VGQEDKYRELTFTVTLSGASAAAVRNATVITAIRQTVATHLNVSIDLVQVLAANDAASRLLSASGAAPALRLLQGGGIAITVVVRTTPSVDATAVTSRLSAMTATTLAPVASALAVVTGQSASAFTLGYNPSSCVSGCACVCATCLAPTRSLARSPAAASRASRWHRRRRRAARPPSRRAPSSVASSAASS